MLISALRPGIRVAFWLVDCRGRVPPSTPGVGCRGVRPHEASAPGRNPPHLPRRFCRHPGRGAGSSSAFLPRARTKMASPRYWKHPEFHATVSLQVGVVGYSAGAPPQPRGIESRPSVLRPKWDERRALDMTYAAAAGRQPRPNQTHDQLQSHARRSSVLRRVLVGRGRVLPPDAELSCLALCRRRGAYRPRHHPAWETNARVCWSRTRRSACGLTGNPTRNESGRRLRTCAGFRSSCDAVAPWRRESAVVAAARQMSRRSRPGLKVTAPRRGAVFRR